VERQQKRIKELEAQFARCRSALTKMLPCRRGGKGTGAARAGGENGAAGRCRRCRGEAHEELNAAVLQTIADSQTDLGVHSASMEAVTRPLRTRREIRVRGFSKPRGIGRIDGSSAEILKLDRADESGRWMKLRAWRARQPERIKLTGGQVARVTVTSQGGEAGVRRNQRDRHDG